MLPSNLRPMMYAAGLNIIVGYFNLWLYVTSLNPTWWTFSSAFVSFSVGISILLLVKKNARDAIWKALTA